LSTEEDLKKTVLRSMLHDRIIGARHTAIENVSKGFPKHLKGQVKDAVEELIKEGFVISKRTEHGRQVSLNKYRIAEIERIIKT